ncbi:hypothetical protein CHIBA101_1395 [Actinomyces sp. Chiba101]|uniref:DUF4191 domain-containing protein n=1 Tax=Actinomyces denticolens TaxID=52767 RepID=A0ABY1IDK4_9ACTO|nr:MULTISPECIES: DUF4191 domain-containing protein [Actinomyces]BAW93251.1 hypothetical protein CHIBA101_1395 [Actinomyces sp. Chiba101]GAV95515.1 hypothetical protein ADENT20671_2312 [Actinomyces denticolens]SHJ02287.1 protein of unknown function [Actinomyces denticolens]SUU04087.1 Uncharacterised protein [Actinomyces denticolens]
MSTARSPQPKKKRRLAAYLQNLKDAYTISRRTYPWIGWALIGVTAASIVLAVAIAAATGMAVWYWVILGIMLAFLLDMILLSWTVRRASYSQIEGVPGAAKAVLDQVGKGWYLEEQPVAVNPKTQDVIWRLVGRPGIVLVVEGPTGRTQRLVADERKKINRILSTVPLHVINVGTDEGQVRLSELSAALRKLPTKPTRLTDSEISQVSKRLSSLGAKGLPIPKGIDPAKIRPDRRALRGR